MYSKFLTHLEIFLKERNWDEYHNMKNLSMALSAECAELLECFTLLDYRESKEEIEDEIADCMITLFSIYRCMKVDIHDHLPAVENLEEEAYHNLKSVYGKKLTIDFLIKLLSVRCGFLLEPFIWLNEDMSENFSEPLPKKTLSEPFFILLTLCHILGISSQEIILKKLEKASRKYPVELAKNREVLHSVLKKKISKRGK